MAVIGFSFSKISIEKKEPVSLKTEVKSKLNVTEVSREDIKLVEGKDTLRFSFEFEIDYSPNAARIDFKGQLLLVEDPKAAEEIIKDWKKNKKMDDGLRLRVYNTIFNKCTVKAFELEEDFSLPLHLRLPQITKGEK